VTLVENIQSVGRKLFINWNTPLSWKKILLAL